MFNNLLIWKRLAIGFGIVIFFTLMIGGVGLYSMDKISVLTHELYEKPYKVSNALRDVGMRIYAEQSAMKDVAISLDDDQINRALKLLRYHDARTQKDFAIVSEASLINEAKFKQFVGMYTEWSELRNEIISLKQTGDESQVVKLIEGEAEDVVAQLEEKIEELIEDSDAAGERFIEAAEDVHEFANFEMIALIFLTVVGGAAISLYIARGITRPLERIVDVMKQIALGDLEHEIKFNRNDEVGILARSFRKITMNLRHKASIADKITAGDLGHLVDVESKQDQLALAMNQMILSLRTTTEENNNQNWFMSGQTELADKLRGDQTIQYLAQVVIDFVANYLHCQVGAIYIADETKEKLHYFSGYAFDNTRDADLTIVFGQGLVGQAAQQKQIISMTEIPSEYIKVNSSLGECPPSAILIVPLTLNNETFGVIELASVKTFSSLEIDFVKNIAENIAIALNSAFSRTKLQSLLDESQKQAELLLQQQTELQAANEELEEQTNKLKTSEEKLKVQQEELQSTNEELEEQAATLKASESRLQVQQEQLKAANEELELKTEALQSKNKEIEKYSEEVTEKAKELELSSKYKSEFLANMSHELRTPLNSLLLLARMLAENSEGNLTEDQVESATIVYNSGHDLLNLINDILDLSKIEAGQMNIDATDVSLKDLLARMENTFSHLTVEKGLDFQIHLGEGVREFIQSVAKRLDQILKNLISNAIKFTANGGVRVDITTQKGIRNEELICFAVIDTGIGIPKDKQKLIFEAFQQVDGGTARQYGGTGLGLSISTQLAKLMGGEISLTSKEGEGSTFKLTIPVNSGGSQKGTTQTASMVQPRRPVPNSVQGIASSDTSEKFDEEESEDELLNVQPIVDDRDSISSEDKVILLIEDDLKFASILLKQSRDQGFKGIAVNNGKAGYVLAQHYQPDAVILDLNLPGMDGFQLLDKLKENPDTRHIPVHIISALDSEADVFKRGAIGFLQKPVEKDKLMNVFSYVSDVIDKDVKDLLLIEDDINVQKAIRKLIGNGDVKITVASTGEAAYELIKETKFDCMILDLGLPDISGFELLTKLSLTRDVLIPPVIVYTGRELTREETDKLREFSQSIIIKGVRSEDRLLDETALFLHRVVGNMPEQKQSMIRNLYDKDSIFVDKKVLIIDDDMRNLFALSKILRDRGIKVYKAQNGVKGLEMIDTEEGIDLVLMDIMMPEMDGYETTRAIRQKPQYMKLPIIALTAKAMKEDRDKCIAAGASDYLSKPVDIERLLSMLRVWLYR